jgi:inner membrane protein
VRERHGNTSPRFPRLAAITSAVANNLPDADLLYAGITGGKLGYLLQHRGHTHTLLGGIVLGLGTALAVIAFARRRNAIARADVLWLLGLGAVGPLVHVGMDAWNVYGVHPFWPFDNAWRYGDAVFIVEPFLWAVALPALVFTARSTAWRVVLGVVLVLGLAFPWVTGWFVPLALRIALILAALGMGLAVWRVRPSLRAVLGMIAFAAVAAVHLAASASARGYIARALAGASTVDVALTAMPANPFCHRAIVVQLTADGELVMRRAAVAVAPALLGLDRCPALPQATAPLTPVASSGDPHVRWEGEYRAPVARLRELYRDNCEVAAMLRFLRTPFFIERPDTITIGDLRYDHEESLGFAEVNVAPRPARCPAFVPPWVPPRSDLLH